MQKVYHLSSLKREFDGYDRWSKEKVSIIDFEKNILDEKEKMNYKQDDINYYDIEVREATTTEIEKFLEKKQNKLQTNQIDLKYTNEKIKYLEKLDTLISKEVLELQNILSNR